MGIIKAVKYKAIEAPQSYWDFVHKYGTIYHSKPYLECLTASGRESFVVVVYDGNDIAGGATITLGGKILGLAINASTYFGPVVKNNQLAGDVLLCLAQAIKKTSLFFSVCVLPSQVNILMTNLEIMKWQKKEIEFLNWDISVDIECLWKNLPKGKKSSVNCARRENVKIQEITTIEHIGQFYKLHTMSMTRGEKLGQPSLTYFEQLLKILRPQGLFAGFLALHPQTEKPIAAVVLLLDMHNTATYLAVGHDYAHRKFGGADILVWHCLEFLKARGFTMFDLVGLPKGESPRAKGICHFKTAWSGTNGHRYPSYVLTCSNFGLNPIVVLATLNFTKKVLNLVSGSFGAR